ncbi:hypothetical protein JAO73_02480 [Hymenobacter sp. BT523]|uniref:toxin-antitoxin system YwqK family antitoxin n=1 Tax=Hymenobacter sp. BT523 TaxID=2795725 RepID=UPI0018EB4361|nr:hypothetical protein [Hymenobacter sp. BT523]MBJ6107861.1 hypothetical protein [Hymenobacter sp. BT523]
MFVFRFGLLCVAGQLAASLAQAQSSPARSAADLAQLTQAPAPTAPLSTYVRVVQGDSVNLFYTPDYRMAQPACAVLRRQTRLDGSGSFNGHFRDARWPSDSVQMTGRYVHGEKDGLFTLYHANGQAQMQGQYRANRRVGEWKVWYPSGRLAEVLSYEPNNPAPTVHQAWDVAGQQQVINGAGIWHRDLGEGNEFSGPVAGGRPLGVWKLSPNKNGRMANWMITETYGPDGTVKAGMERTAAGQTDRYHGASRVQFWAMAAFEAAERFQLQPPCQPRVVAVNTLFKPAFYRGGASAYWELLWSRLRPLIEDTRRNGVSPLTEYRGVLSFRVRLDAHGNWQNEPSQPEGTNLEAARQLLNLMRNLPRWEPAHLDGVPVESTATVEYTAGLDRYSLMIRPGQGAGQAPPPVRP